MRKVIILKPSEMRPLQKGKAYPEGTVRTWQGKDYKKVGGKWAPVKGKKAPAKKITIAQEHVDSDTLYDFQESLVNAMNKDSKIKDPKTRIENYVRDLQHDDLIGMMNKYPSTRSKIKAYGGVSKKAPAKKTVAGKGNGKVDLSKEKADFKKYASDYGLKPEWLGKKTSNGSTIAGLNRRSQKYQVILKDPDGKLKQQEPIFIKADFEYIEEKAPAKIDREGIKDQLDKQVKKDFGESLFDEMSDDSALREEVGDEENLIDYIEGLNEDELLDEMMKYPGTKKELEDFTAMMEDLK